MRLVRLDTKKANGAKGQAGVDLVVHPQMTVVLGATGQLRDTLIDAIAGIPRGIASAGGVIDVGGVREDLSAESLARHGLRADLDVVVRATDLPHHENLTVERTAARRTAAVARDEARRALLRAEATAQKAREHQEAVTVRLEELRPGGEVEAAAVAFEGAAEAASLARADASAQLEEAMAERVRLEEEIGRLRTESDAASAALADAEQTVAAASRTEPSAFSPAISDEEPSCEDPELGIAATAREDPAPVLACLDRIERALNGEAVPVQAALAFADAWHDLHQQLANLERTETDQERSAKARVDAARRAAVDAEQDLRVSALDPELVAALEAAHTAVLDAQERSSSRFSGTRARLRLDELRAAESAALDQLGFATYADYMMSSSSRGVGASKRAVLQAARVRVAEAEAEWQALGGDPSRDAQRTELLDQRSAIAPRIALLLGHEPEGPAVERELRALRAIPSVDDLALAELRSTLSDVGVKVGDEQLPQEELLRLAHAWVDENGRLDERRAPLGAELRGLDDQHSEIGDTAASDDGAEQSTEQVGVSLDQAQRGLEDSERRHVEVEAAIDEAQIALAELLEREEAARAQVVAHDAPDVGFEQTSIAQAAEVEQQLERADEEVAAADFEVDRLRGELASAEDRLADLVAAEEAAGATAEPDAPEDREELIEEIEWYLLARLAAQRAVGDAGSVPLVLDDTFRDLDVAEVVRVMESMERMSGAVQVIAVSDDRALSFWAEALGEERAGVVSLGG